MKRISIVAILPIVAILTLVLAACGSTSVGTSPVSGTTGPVPVSGTTGPSLVPSSSAYSTVSGQIVRQDTGQPYPNAWVRFGWLVSAGYEEETHTVTDADGRYTIQLPPGQYQVTAGDSCDLNAGFDIAGRAPDDNMITVPGTPEVDLVEYPITSQADVPGDC
jgi:Carboxypeptidase regulatory-like domain